MKALLVPDDIDFKKYERSTETSVRVRGVDRWSDELEKMILNGNEITGDKLPWAKTHDQIRFRPGEVTVWAGINEHGKSLVTGMVSMALANQASNVCIASIEMKPEMTLYRMLKQAAMTGQPSVEIKNRFVDWLSEKLFVYDHIGVMDADTLFGAIKWTSDNLGVKHFFVDNLGLCIRRADDLNEQKEFIVRSMTVAKQFNVHIHIVHHIKKMENEYVIPGKFDIKGGGEIVDYVDQAIIVFRNKRKEEEIEKLLFQGEHISDDLKNRSDAILNVVKNRHGTGNRIHLWYDKDSQQYLGNPGKKLINMMGEYSFKNDQPTKELWED